MHRKNSAIIWLLFAMIAVSAFAIQYSTLPKITDFVFYLNIEPGAVRSSIAELIITNWMVLLNFTDFMILSFLFFAVLGLVVFEVWKSGFSGFLQRLSNSPRGLMFFLLFLAILSTRYYLNRGHLFMNDNEGLGMRAWMVAEHLKNLQWPVWSNYWYGGFPLLPYYAPLYFLVIGLVHVILDDIYLATKLVLWVSHIASIFVMFYFLREAIPDNYSALIGSLSYGIVFYRIHVILYEGDVNVNLVWLLYPVIFLIIEKYLNGKYGVKKSFLFFSFTVAFLILTHHGYGLFGLVFVGIYLLVRISSSKNTGIAKVKALGFFAAGGIGGVLLSAFSLLPVILETGDVRWMPKFPFSHLLLWPPPVAVLYAMFRWTPVGVQSAGTAAYVGISLWIFALLSIVYCVKKKASIGLALTVCALASLFTVKLGTQYNTKNLAFVIFFIAALTAYLPQLVHSWLHNTRVGERLRRRWGEYAAVKPVVCVMALIFLDLGPLTFQNTFIEHFYDLQDAMYAKILRLDKNHKVIERRMIRYDPTKSLGAQFEPQRSNGISAYVPIQTPLGQIHEASAKSVSYNSEMLKKLQLDLNQGVISDLSLKAVSLMDVKFLVFRDRYHYFSPPLQSTPYYSIDDLILEFKYARPLLVSTRVIHVNDLPDYDKGNAIETHRYFDADMQDYTMPYYDPIIRPLIDKMGINLERGTADYLIIRDNDVPPSTVDDPRDVNLQIKDFSVSIDEVKIRYNTDVSGYGRVAYSYFAYLDVRIDGKKTRFYRSAMHYIIVPLPRGEHVVSIRGQDSPLRKVLFGLAVFPVLGVLFFPSRLLAYVAAPTVRQL